MGLEAGTFISDLVATNPPSSDVQSQGDDHLRLIKSVLQNTFPFASKAFALPSVSASKTASFLVASDSPSQNRNFLVDTTSGIVTATLPALTVPDAGWECSFIKTNLGTNPLLIAPTSGTLQSGAVTGLSATRRCVPGVRFRALWTGLAWIVERVVRTPIDSMLEIGSATLPVGFEWANGQTLASAAANYPDYLSVRGSAVVPTKVGNFALTVE